MFKEMLLKKMLNKQLAGLPPEQQEKIIKVVSENPEFFQKISGEIKQKMDEGKNQMTASMEVMKKYQGELGNLMGK